MLRNLLFFEFGLQARQLAFGLFLVGYFALATLLGFRVFGGENEMVNSAHSIMLHLGILSLTLVFPAMFFVVKASLRDRQYDFAEILFSTSVSKRHFFASRYLGILLCTLAVVLVATLGFAIGISLSDVSVSRKLPLDLLPYSFAFCYLLLPNAVVLTALLFGLSLWTQSSRVTYLGAILLYAAYWLCAIFLNSPMLANAVPAAPGNLALAALLDPFGLSALFEQTQYWTIVEKNQDPISLSGLLLWNRVLWLSVAGLLIGLIYSTFSWRKEEVGSSKKEQQPVHLTTSTGRGVTWARTMPHSWLFQWQAFRSILRQDLVFLFRSLPFLLSLAALTLIIGLEMYTFIRGGGSYQENLFPTTAILIERMIDPLLLFTPLLLLFYIGELMWRDRSTHFVSIVDATPVLLASRYFAKLVSLLFIPFMTISLAILVGVSFQLVLGYDQLKIGFWLGMYYYQGSQLLLYAAFSMAIHMLVKNKYAGLLLSVLLLLLLGSSLSSLIGIHHPLLQLVKLPWVLPADMNAYGYATFAFHHYAVYWIAFVSLLTLWAIGFWKYPRRRISRTPMLIGGAFLLLTGGKIIFHTQVEIDYTTPAQVLDNMEAYERLYKQYEELPHLHYHAISSQVDLYPKERRLVVEADYILINKQADSIHQLLLSARVALDTVALEGAILVSNSSKHQTERYVFSPPIAPGEQIRFYYKTTIQHGAFSNDHQLVENGSFLLNRNYEPVLFYRPSQEINDPHERMKRGLPPKAEKADTEEHLLQHSPGLGRVDFEVTLSAPSRQIAIAPGQLIKHWQENGRNFYHYKSEWPIIPLISFLAGVYEVERTSHRGIQIEQYYHPEHYHNIDSIQRYITATLDYCTAQFGPYPYDHLRVVEIPSHWNFGGQAQAGTIAMVADRLYLTDIRDPQAFNLIAKRTIHEVAHQWWGHVLAPKNTAGAALIIEGLAKYTEAVVMQQLFGPESRAQIMEEAQRRYLRGRAFDQEPEPPLYLQDGQSYLAYGKSCLALLAVEELMGEQQMNEALRDLIGQFGHQMDPKMTSLDLLDALRCYLPAQQHALLEKWFMESGRL